MSEKKEETNIIKDWELVDPLELIKAIDETMELLEKNNLKQKDVKENLYNILFLIRQNMFMITGLIKITGVDKVKAAIKLEATKMYT